MDANPTVLLVTQRFPFAYETGEMYLHEEVRILSEKFSRVVIVACFAKECGCILDLPDNVVAISAAPGVDGAFQKKYLFWGLATALAGKNSDKRAKTFKQRVVLNSYSDMAVSIANNALLKLSRGMHLSEIGVIYSYRMTMTAIVGARIAASCEKEGRRPALVSRAHGYDLYEKESACGLQPFRYDVLRAMDAVFPCSKKGCSFLLGQEGPRIAGSVSCSYLGSRDHKGLNPWNPSKKIRLVSCSNVIGVKRVQMIAETLVAARAQSINVTWTHFGEGKQFRNLEQFCSSALPSECYCLEGRVGRDRLFSCYAENCFDLFVNVSSSEGISQAIMEAISFGIPVIATDVGGTSEIVANYLNGFLIDGDNAREGLLKALEEYRSMSQEEVFRLRRNARLLWETSFNANDNAAVFARELARLCCGEFDGAKE